VRDAVNCAREAVDFARDASIPARKVANPPSIHVVIKNIMAK
jgi:hypothetical protein